MIQKIFTLLFLTCLSLSLGISGSYAAIDLDNDGISDDGTTGDTRDRYVNPNPDINEVRYVCNKRDIDLHLSPSVGFIPYGCINPRFTATQIAGDPYHMLGVFSQEKKALTFDSDRDSVKDFEDRQVNTPESQRIYVCTHEDIRRHQNRLPGFISYGCFNDTLLGVYVEAKKRYLLGDSDESLGTPNSPIVDGAQIQGGGLNLDTGEIDGGTERNDPLKDLRGGDDRFWNIENNGERGIVDVLITAARDLKNLFFVFATIFLLYLVLRLLMSENSEEDTKKFKNGILWTTVGIVVMQIAYSFVKVLYDRGLGSEIANTLQSEIFEPLITLLETIASFGFIAMGVVAFYRLITSNGEEQAATDAKTTMLNAILGFLMVQLAAFVVGAVYQGSSGISVEPGGFNDIVLTIIDWMNGFVGIAVIVMIIYAGAQVLLSGGEEEKLSNAKKALIYIVIGIAILLMNFLILTFFFEPSSPII